MQRSVSYESKAAEMETRGPRGKRGGSLLCGRHARGGCRICCRQSDGAMNYSNKRGGLYEPGRKSPLQRDRYCPHLSTTTSFISEREAFFITSRQMLPNRPEFSDGQSAKSQSPPLVDLRGRQFFREFAFLQNYS